VCTGIWVIAHECGHQAFSKWQAVNDAVGLVLHSCLLVPYYSWKHSHRRHHSNTGSVTRDEVFVPAVDEAQVPLHGFFFYRVGLLMVQQLAGWPSYLFFNASGREYSRFACHFDPYSPIFSPRERAEVAVSDAALAAVLYGLYGLANAYGWAWLAKVYIVPYLIVNFWLVMITFLQHTHPQLPHYDDSEWDWLRGALATVDRTYGFLDVVFHHIADTHVTHHLFSAMPHYHAQEATEAIKKVLGPYYCRDDRNVMAALWQETRTCHWVAPDAAGGGVLWFRSKCDVDGGAPAGKDE
jgi:omega-6 fatty acid desaturase (delta-12 desaturase)